MTLRREMYAYIDRCFNAGPTLQVGATLYGYCGGAFGRDSYGTKTVEAVGADWVVVREAGGPNFAAIDPKLLLEYTKPEKEG